MDRSLCEGDGTPDLAGKPVTGSNRPAYDLEKVRRDFPILASRVHGHPLVYLDTAASAQKPRAVIDAMTRFIEQDYANVHRGVHSLAERATEGYEGARARVQRFLNARKPGEIVFTAGATAALNLVAGSWGAANLKAGRPRRPFGAGASLQYRALAAPARTRGHRDRRGAGGRCRRAGPRRRWAG